MNRGWKTALAVVALCLATNARGELLFDFEGPYLVDPGRTIKDHELVFDGQLWHCIYIRGIEGASGTNSETELGHATSSDLHTWQIEFPVLEIGPQPWDARNVWAPAIFRTPANPSQWTMLYTGTDAKVVQRMGRAFTTNGTLDHFDKLLTNPVLEPDSTIYDWSSEQWFSSFRDPFYFFDGGVHHVLHTAGLKDGQRRGVVHHATSTDLLTWTDAGVLAQNNNDALGTQWHDLESVQLIENGGDWFLFYTEQNMEGIRWVKSSQRDSGYDISAAQVIDPEGIATEVTPLDGQSFLFTRHIPFSHSATGPDSNLVSWTVRADTLRFAPGSGNPYLISSDPLAGWPIRSGSAFVGAPTFGDNVRERGLGDSGIHGHGFLSTRDFYAGPASGVGQPGGDLGVAATGVLQSPDFVVSPGSVSMSLLVGGGPDPACFVGLFRATDDSLLYSTPGPGTDAMQSVTWDVSGLQGTLAYLRVEDNSTGPTGWITVDEVRLNPSVVAAPPLASNRAHLLANQPNPFNPRTNLRFVLDVRSNPSLQIHDLRGRSVRRLSAGWLDAGTHALLWDGTDHEGADVASGVYLVQLVVAGRGIDAQKVTLIR